MSVLLGSSGASVILGSSGGGVMLAALPPEANALTLTDVDSTTTTNYPVQFGRPFAESEIADYPQAIISGTPVTTQANVKTRWPDGSVKHAIVSFLVPSLTADSTVTITFQNQASGNTTGYLDKAGMLGAGYDFNATIAHALALPYDTIVMSPTKRPFKIADKGVPVAALFG